QAAHLAGKRLELLREVVPQLRRLAIIFNVGNAQPVLEMRETEAAARTLGVEVVRLEIRRVADFSPPSRRSGETRTRFILQSISSWSPISCASLRLPWARGFQRSSALAILSEAGASCPMDQVTPNVLGARQITSTRYCAGPSPAIYQSSSRRSSSLLSI